MDRKPKRFTEVHQQENISSNKVLIDTATHLTKLANKMLNENPEIVNEEIWAELSTTPAMLIGLANKLVIRKNKSILNERIIQKRLILNKQKNTTNECKNNQIVVSINLEELIEELKRTTNPYYSEVFNRIP